MVTSPVEFRVLGPLGVSDGGDPVALGGGRQRALLALLLLHANDILPLERIIEELWAGKAPASAGKIVQKYVLQLRRALGEARLVTRGSGYFLRVEGGELDSQVFERLLEEARADGGGDAIRAALALWRGSPFGDFRYETFAQGEIARLEELHLGAVEDRIDSDLAAGFGPRLVGELEALVADHPLRERLRGQHMLALYQAGRQSEALAAYRETRSLLADELGLEPAPELRELERAILAHDPALTRSGSSALPGALPEPTRVGRLGPLLVAAIAAVGAAVAVPLLLTQGGGSEPPPLGRANSVLAIDAGTARVVADVPVQRGPAALALGGGSLWVGNAGDRTVSRIDPRTRRVTQTIGVGTAISGLAPGFGSLWVAGGEDGTLTRIDLVTGAVQDTVAPRPAKGAPIVAVAAGAGAVWVVANNLLIRIDPVDLHVRALVPVAAPTSVTVDGGDVWVTSGRTGGYTYLARGAGAPVRTRTLGAAAVLRVDRRGSIWAMVGSGRRALWRDTGYGLYPVESVRAHDLVALTLDADGVWIVDRAGSLLLLRGDPAEVLRSATLGGHATALAAGAGTVWVALGSHA